MFYDFTGYEVYDPNVESEGIFAGSDGSANSIAVVDERTETFYTPITNQPSAPIVSGGGWSNSSGDYFGTITGGIKNILGGVADATKAYYSGVANVKSAESIGKDQVKRAESVGTQPQSQSNLTRIKTAQSPTANSTVIIGLIALAIAFLK
jgi:hypothetical protein